MIDLLASREIGGQAIAHPESRAAGVRVAQPTSRLASGPASRPAGRPAGPPPEPAGRAAGCGSGGMKEAAAGPGERDQGGRLWGWPGREGRGVSISRVGRTPVGVLSACPGVRRAFHLRRDYFSGRGGHGELRRSDHGESCDRRPGGGRSRRSPRSLRGAPPSTPYSPSAPTPVSRRPWPRPRPSR